MPDGRCLCGELGWSIEGELELAHACHCSMCRKAYGTAYCAYAEVRANGFRWTGAQTALRRYRSSESNWRCFCGRCGSVVPSADEGDERIGVPLGSLEGVGKLALQAHIFVGSKAPWHEITDGLPEFAELPRGYDAPRVAASERAGRATDGIGGSCLCGVVAYEVAPPLLFMRHCHCSRCRRARSSPCATNAMSTLAAFHFTAGESELRSWKVPEAQFFTQSFCSHCSSPMPVVSIERDLVVIPAGSFDDDPQLRPSEHIFVGSKARWLEISDDLPQHVERP